MPKNLVPRAQASHKVWCFSPVILFDFLLHGFPCCCCHWQTTVCCIIIKVIYKYYGLFWGEKKAWDSLGLEYLPTKKLCQCVYSSGAFSNPYEILGSKFHAVFIYGKQQIINGLGKIFLGKSWLLSYVLNVVHQLRYETSLWYIKPFSKLQNACYPFFLLS